MIAGFANWLRHHARLFTSATILVVSIAATVIAVGGVRGLAAVERLDQYVRDLEVAKLTPPEPQDSNIIVDAIKESTFPAAHLAYREPIDRAFLAHVLTAIASGHPRAIGLDVLLDGPTEPAKDEELRQVLRSLQVPLVIAYSDNPNVVDPQQLDWLNKFVPENLRGNVSLGEDSADVARWVYPGAKGPGGHYVMGFSRAIASKLGVQTTNAELPLVWHGRPSADDEAFQEWPAEQSDLSFMFKDKVVLVGIDITLRDQHRTPFDTIEEFGQGQMPGVVIQAHTLAQLLEHRSTPDVGFTIDLIIAFLAALIGARLGAVNFSMPMRIGASILAAGIFVSLGLALFRYANIQIALVAPTIAMAIALWGSDSLTGLDARRQREFIHGVFSRYVSPKLVEQLVKDPSRLSLEGERREMTFLFSDIESWTTMSEKLESRELATVLNGYLEGVTRCVLKYDGMVDKYIGDSVFAIFNAPLDLANHEQCAVQCALDMNDFSSEYAAQQQARGVPFGRTRIGVHTGTAVIGNFGSSTRFSYTASGDAVNLASRLEGINKHFHTWLAISETTRKECSKIPFRPIAEVVVKGKSEPIEIFQPYLPDERDAGFMERYTAAYEALKKDDPSAQKMFAALAQEAPDDPLVSLHAGRIAKGEHGVVIVMTEK